MSTIRVICRLRPENSIEKESGSQPCVSFTNTTIQLKLLERSEETHEFTFDQVCGPDVPQDSLFEHAAKPVVQGVLDGYNGTIFAYGQTGSGKTYTMEGFLSDASKKGIIPRMMDALFEGLVQASESTEFTLRVSFLEIYLERIHDLLDSTKNNLQVKEDKLRGIYVQNSTEVYVASPNEMMKVMITGSANRSIAATRMNERSSRSHSIFCVNVEQKDSLGNKKTGRLYFVDLAGSESVGKTNVSGQQLKEAQMINKSLSALGNVINALTDKASNYVPYRDSKLTRILQESIGGNSQTSLIIACSMSGYNDKETLGTLRFGQRAKKIQNKPVVNQEKSSKELQKLVENMQNELKKQAEVISRLHFHIKNRSGQSEIEEIISYTYDPETLRVKEPERKDSEYALTLLKQHIELVRLHEELQELKGEKKEVEDELNYRNKEINELELQMSELQQAVLQERAENKRASEELQSQLRKSANDLQAANLIVTKSIKICERLKSDLQLITSELPKTEKFSEILNQSLTQALFSLSHLSETPIDCSDFFESTHLKSELIQQLCLSQKHSTEIKDLKEKLETQTDEILMLKGQCELLTRQLNTKSKNIEEERTATAEEIRYKDLQILELQDSLKQEKIKSDALKTVPANSKDLKDRLEELTKERQSLLEEFGTVRRELEERDEQLQSALRKNKRLERQIAIQSQNKPTSFSRALSPSDEIPHFTGKITKPIRGGGGNYSNFQRNNQIIQINSDLLLKRRSVEKIAYQGSGIQSKIKDLFGGLLG